MANEKSILAQYNGLPAIVRILIQLFVGPLASWRLPRASLR